MSHQSSSSSWSKFFKQPGSNNGGSTKSPPHSANQTYNPYSDNPFHRPPSSTSTYVSNAASEATFRTGSASTASGSTLKGSHNYQVNNTPPMSSHDLDADEGECPVCLEPLSFSFRLPGEKPHVVPECGHALHEACFSAVYGPLPSRNPAGGIPRKSSLGVCGVCRRPMKVGDGDGGKSNKLAALTGMGERASPSPYAPNSSGGMPSKLGPGTGTMRSGAGGPRRDPYDPMEDDPIEKDHHSGASAHGHGHGHGYGGGGGVVAPSITVRSEFATIHRASQPVQPLTCIVVVELPSKRAGGAANALDPPEVYRSINPATADDGYGYQQPQPHQLQQQQQQQGISRKASSIESGQFSTYRGDEFASPTQQRRGGIGGDHHQTDSYGGPPTTANSYGSTSYNAASTHYNSGLSGTSSNGADYAGTNAAFASITEDLRTRVADWKGHPMAGLGPLQMFDILSVRRDVLVREFYVYLFKEAVICVLEEKKKSLGRLLSPTGSDAASTNGSTFSGQTSSGNKGVLRLKGRIYIRHIKQVHDTSSAGELSLTIDMEDERLESFILIFRDRPTLENWRTSISNLVLAYQQGGGESAAGSVASSGRHGGDPMGSSSATLHGGSTGGSRHGHGELDDFGAPMPPNALPKGISGKAARMLSGSTSNSDGGSSTSLSQVDSLGMGMGRSAASSATSGGQDGGGYAGGYVGSGGGGESRTITPHVASSASNSLQPLPHPALDLILVIAVPPGPGSPVASVHTGATAQLKIRVIRNTLDFVLGQLGHRDRLSLVTFEVGPGGRVRKSPFLCPGRSEGRRRLISFVNGILGPEEGDEKQIAEDTFLVRNANEEKTDVVTAVNHGLDVVLQRKQKNSVSGMILVSDAADSTRRAQMDLVLARAEAANVPIHSFGYGRSHDPASLWLISNHTSGTYTFVKDWYDLRDCLAGCLGGMMSIGLLNMKLHMKIVDANRFRIRKVSGGPTSIVAQDGKDVHVEVGELRFGERKEMLIELELDNNLDIARMNNMGVSATNGGGGHGMHDVMQSRNGGMMNATDAFVARMGLDISGDSPNLMDGVMDRMIDEVPVFEVDGSFFDPAVAKQVNRLAHPVLLTVTLMPITNRPQQNQQPPVSDAMIVRRRMELLASDMVTRALVLVSRKNYSQAQRILAETTRILHTVLQNVSQSLPPPSRAGGAGANPMGARNRKEVLIFSAVRALQAMLHDLQILTDALDENVDIFAHDQRNFGAQQAMILRDQKSWSKRSAVERLFWTVDNSIELVGRSVDWVGRE